VSTLHSLNDKLLHETLRKKRKELPQDEAVEASSSKDKAGSSLVRASTVNGTKTEPSLTRNYMLEARTLQLCPVLSLNLRHCMMMWNEGIDIVRG
jgi:hypothetical protein